MWGKPYPGDSCLCIRKTARTRDYLNGYEPFGRYNFFNISTPIGAGRRPLKDHPSTKVGRLPRRHRKTPSSGSGAAPVISRKPHHFACIIHSNSPGSPLAARRRISRRDRKEATWNDHFTSLFSLARETDLSAANVVIGMSSVRGCSSAFTKHCWRYTSGLFELIFLVDDRLNLYYANVRRRKIALCSCRCITPPSKCRRPPFVHHLRFKPILKSRRGMFTCIVS